MSINLDYYKIFHAVAREKSITKAAEKLYISQPAVTQTVAKLESLLGEKLLIRQSKGILLTHLGKQIFEEVEQGLKHFDQVDTLVANQKNLVEGTVYIGGGTNIVKELLPNPMEAFLKKYPAIKFVLVDEHRKVLFDQLAQGEVDIAITQKNQLPSHLTYHKLLCENSVFFCHKDFELPEFLPKEQLAKLPLIVSVVTSTSRAVLAKVFAENQLPLEPKIEVSGHNMVLELVRQNLGIGVLPQYLLENDLARGDIKLVHTDLTLPIYEYGCIYNSQNLSPATREFLTFLLA